MSSFPPPPPGPPDWPPGPPGPPDPYGTASQPSGPSSAPDQPVTQRVSPYGSPGQPVTQLSNPYGSPGQPVAQPSNPYGFPDQPAAQPYGSYGSPGQPVAQPYGPYGMPGQPPGPYGPVGQPMVQPSHQSHDPLVQFLNLALTGFGYNFYNTKNQARADDLLVRAKASGFLTDAAASLTTLAEEYHRLYVPPLSREHPDPPVEAMAVLDDLRRLQEEIARLETLVRAMAVPTADRIWERFRAELPTLRQLMQFDLDLVRGAQSFAQQAASASAATWTAAQAQELRAMLHWLNQVSQARSQFLSVPT